MIPAFVGADEVIAENRTDFLRPILLLPTNSRLLLENQKREFSRDVRVAHPSDLILGGFVGVVVDEQTTQGRVLRGVLEDEADVGVVWYSRDLVGVADHLVDE